MIVPPLLVSAQPGPPHRFSSKRWFSIPAIAFTFLFYIVIGTGLLLWSGAQRDGVGVPLCLGHRVSFLDALFTATSAATLTGLSVVDMHTWSPAGELVLLALMQLGGLTYMVAATVVALRLGLRMGLQERLQLPEGQGIFRGQEVLRVVRYAVIATLGIEIIGAALLAVFMHDGGSDWGYAAYSGLFTSVSAFCNAGLTLTPLTGETGVLLTVAALALLGGLGIGVIAELARIVSRRRLSLHAKIVLTTTLALIAFGAVAFWFFERWNPQTAGAGWVDALFMSITARSAGFSPVDVAALSPPTLFVLGLLGIIGGAPGGTAGGVKVTTLAVITLAIATLMRKRADIEVFKRRVSGDMVRLALSLLVMYLLVALVAVLGVSAVEITLRHLPPGAETMDLYSQLVFEVMSALGTVGLSTGITPALSPISQSLLIVIMFLGRVGPLAFVFAYAQPKRPRLHRYPAESVMAG